MAEFHEVRELIRLLQQPRPQKVEVMMGVVDSVQSNTCTVMLSGMEEGLPGFHWLLDAYTPVAGHTVMIIKNGPDKFILGRLS
jgi:hypothetical protein